MTLSEKRYIAHPKTVSFKYCEGGIVLETAIFAIKFWAAQIVTTFLILKKIKICNQGLGKPLNAHMKISVSFCSVLAMFIVDGFNICDITLYLLIRSFLSSNIF